MSMGGIAAAAALAARKKNRQRDDKSTEFMKDDEQEDVEMKSITAAALGKFSRTAENVNEMYSTEFEDHCALRQIDSGIICGTSGSQTRAQLTQQSMRTHQVQSKEQRILLGHGEDISRLVRPVAKRAPSDDMSAFARELKVGPNSSEDADSDNSSLQVLHLDSNIISYDSDRTASSSSEPKGRQTFNSTALRQTEISLTGTKEGRNLYHLRA